MCAVRLANPPDPGDPWEAAGRRVATADVYVDVFAHRYGTIPTGHLASVADDLLPLLR